MEYSERERISHVVRRLGFGTQPGVIEAAGDVDGAIAAALDVSSDNPPAPEVAPPSDRRDQRDGEVGLRYFFEMLVMGPRRIEERMTWFWHDHFATDARKVGFAFLMFRQHLTIRRNATESFADLLYDMATDPAMLIYLDGRENSVDAPNENFGREVLELYTLGRGSYSEADVLAASRAFSGWVVVPAEGRARDVLDADPGDAVFVPFRHDGGSKTLLGVTGPHDAAAAVEILLEHPDTARQVAGKLYVSLVGLPPAEDVLDRIAGAFRRDYQVMDLIHAIVSEPAFVSDAAIRTKKRTPLEQAVGVFQSFGAPQEAGRGLLQFLESTGYTPFRPPNPAGYPKGGRLLGPYALVHTFDLVGALADRQPPDDVDEAAARLGLFDLSAETRSTLAMSTDSRQRMALLLNSPEYHVV